MPPSGAFCQKFLRKQCDRAIDLPAGLGRIVTQLRAALHIACRIMGEGPLGIARILMRKGVAEEQVIVRSFGDTRPQATNDTPEGRYLNRRVEVRMLSD